MKRILTALGLMALAVGASAQTMYDALNYSAEEYVGSARTMAMGNAVTALGGDPGSVHINPAGGAVAGYSQFSLSMGANVSSTLTQGTTLDGASSPYCFGDRTSYSWPRFICPNMAISFNVQTGRSFGLKSWAFNLIASSRSYFQDYTYASGVHDGTSIAGALAAQAAGVASSEYDADTAYDRYGWGAVLGWRSGMICTAGDSGDQYVGATEKFIENEDGSRSYFTAGALDQTFGRRVTGCKSDYIINMAFNISDLVYLGVTGGITTINYIYDDYLKESPVAVSDFDIDFGEAGQTYFTGLKYQSWYNATGCGLYAKFGAIFTPGPMRIGLAFQTPTGFSMRETWGAAAETHYQNSSFDGSASTPEGDFRYRLRTPMRASIGVAGTIAGLAVLSADYEFASNRSMRFSDYSEYTGDFDAVNEDIRNCMGMNHQLRLGAEVKPLSWLSVRAGYGLNDTRTGFRSTSTVNAWETMDHSASCGLGFSTKGSFYADLGFKSLLGHHTYIYPYDDYDAFSDGTINHWSPEIYARRNLYTILCTVGFRF